jgi:Arc/MetJ-type ribon-helix-helix transcriptional regulator
MPGGSHRSQSEEGLGAKRGSRVVTISLPRDEAAWLDEITHLLVAAKLAASRSSVVREALLRFRDSVEGKPTRDVVWEFVSRQARRGAAKREAPVK